MMRGCDVLETKSEASVSSMKKFRGDLRLELHLRRRNLRRNTKKGMHVTSNVAMAMIASLDKAEVFSGGCI